MADFPGLIYTHLADTMTADGAAVAAIVRKFVRFDTRDPDPNRIKGGQPGDTKTGKLLFDLDNISDTGQTQPATFVACERIRRQVITFRLKIILDDVRLLPMTEVLDAIYTDLASAVDPTAADKQDLGIDGCNTQILATSFRSVRTKRDEDADDRYRRIGVLTIPVRITSEA